MRRWQLPSWLAHAIVFSIETCGAIALGSLWCSSSCAEWDADVDRLDDELLRLHGGGLRWGHTIGRRLVANDFTAEFSRRLSFHKWIEEDVVLDGAGFELYLQRALAAAGLVGSPDRPQPRSRVPPQSAEKIQRDLLAAGFRFNAAFAAQEHHMLPGAPWSQGRDRFMQLVQHGLRPNHYYFSAGCGPFSTSGHVVRYLLTSRYYCIEHDEYLLRAAVEYEVPSAGLIHKRPSFLWHPELDIGALKYKRAPGVPAPPLHFDFALVQQHVRHHLLSIAG